MTTVVINGNTYSDDGTAAKDMLNGGHRTHFFPLVQDVVTVATEVEADRVAAAASEAGAAVYAAALVATSSSSIAIGTGSKVFAIGAGKQFAAGQFVRVSRTGAAEYLWGEVTSYSAGNLTVDVQLVSGSGTYASWTIGLAGPRGVAGTTAVLATASKSAAYTAVAGDLGYLLNCTGTWSLSLTAAATLGAGWFAYVLNSGSGSITIDPATTELVDGASTYTVGAGEYLLLLCDGSAFSIVHEAQARMRRLPILQANAGWNAASNGENLIAGSYATGLSGTSIYVLSGESLLIAAGLTSQSSIATSADGITWTLRTMPSSQIWVIAYNGTDFLAFANNGTATATSADGITWTGATALPGAAAHAGGPAWVGGLWLIKGSGTTYYTSPTGAVWTSRTLPAAPDDSSVYVSNGVAWFRSSASQAYTSSDGINWPSRSHSNVTQPGVDLDGALLGVIGRAVYSSADGGVTWASVGVDAPGAPAVPYLTANGVRLAGDSIANGGAWTGVGTWTQRYALALAIGSPGRTSRYARSSYGALLGSTLALCNLASVSLITVGSAGVSGLYTK